MHPSCQRLVSSLLLVLTLTTALSGWSADRTQPAVDRVLVMTSYPEELTVRYQMAFERLHPGKRVEILWRQSADALAWLQQHPGSVDVYWTPSPGNFAALREQGRLARLTLDREALPVSIGSRPISDPEGYFAAFELAGYGIASNTETLQHLGLPVPREWQDLADPAWRGQVQLPIPSRVGFAPVLIETLLQAQGWDQGWALLSAIAANADLTGRGGSQPGASDLVEGRVAARLTIDFFAASAQSDGAPLVFAYPRKTTYNPAQVGVFADAPNPANAHAFVDFVLSDEGQRLLLHPDVRRLPVRKDLYATLQLPAQPFAQDNLSYDAALGRARQGLVATLFDLALVQPHAELAALWQLLHQAEQQGQAGHPALLRARELLETPPLPAALQQDAELQQLFAARRPASGAEAPPVDAVRTRLEADWSHAVQQRLAAARLALQSL